MNTEQIRYSYFPGPLAGTTAPPQGEHTLDELRLMGWSVTFLAYHIAQPASALLLPAAKIAGDKTEMLSPWAAPVLMPEPILDSWARVMWATRYDAEKSQAENEKRVMLRKDAMERLRSGDRAGALSLFVPEPDAPERPVQPTILGRDAIYVVNDGL